jgi:flagellin-like hook-associated protein FlgL
MVTTNAVASAAAVPAVQTAAITTAASAVQSRSASTVCGDFTVTGGTLDTDYTFKNGVLTVLTGAAISIQNTDPSVVTQNQIYVEDGVNANITLAGVNIDHTDSWAVKIADNSKGNVKITLEGDNTLVGGGYSAALEKSSDESSGTLTINGDGSLTATVAYWAAAIGGHSGNSASNIVIESGTITANGGYASAGIGGGSGANGSNITISGGTVKATGGYTGGSGIGGSNSGTGTNIKITGGTVIAQGGHASGVNNTYADAIGSGLHATANSSDVQRLGGVITENGVTTDYGIYTPPTVANQWWIQSGALDGSGMFLKIDFVNADTIGIDGLDVTTEQGAGQAIASAASALDYISRVRSEIGAQQNRLEHTIANENNIAENTTAVESRIRDTDMASEMVAYSIANILAQAGEAVLAQVNQNTQGVLSLLR